MPRPDADRRCRDVRAETAIIMPFVDAAPLPPWLAAELPIARRAYRLERGPDAGRRLAMVDRPAPRGTPPTAPVVVCLHGNPTWSFLWRRVIAALPEFRVVAPDLLGCGLSDGLPRADDHRLDRHLDALAELLDALAPRRVVLVGQDWGGPMVTGLGARLHGSAIVVGGVVLANTAVILPAHPRGTTFHRLARLPLLSWLLFVGLGFPLGVLHRVQGDPRSIRGQVARAYRWPRRLPDHRVTALGLTRMVPDGPAHESLPALRGGEVWLRGFTGPVTLVWGSRDPVLGRAPGRHRRELPAARVVEAPGAGHFLQEEVPEVLAEEIRAIASR